MALSVVSDAYDVGGDGGCVWIVNMVMGVS